ncbi:MAG TPA: hypothetical protein VJP77_06340, partial [Planctomycetota bacterium]|nr:hypothetical protein [Planctomycetota bacterium]
MLVAERVARILISVGGIGTILSVSLIFFFLLWVVFPLFGGAALDGRVERAVPVGPARYLQVGLDEYRTLLWLLGDDGVVRAVRIDDGELLGSRALALDGSAP